MPVNDPVGDMLTRMRNASRARHDKVVIPARKLKVAIARSSRDEGYMADYTVRDPSPGRDHRAAQVRPGRRRSSLASAA